MDKINEKVETHLDENMAISYPIHLLDSPDQFIETLMQDVDFESLVEEAMTEKH